MTKRLRLLRYGIFFSLILSLFWLGVDSVVCVSVGGHRRSRGLVVHLIHPLRRGEDGGVDLGVEVEESLLRSRVEAGERQLDRLLLVTEDGERLADLLQTAGGDDVIQAALLEAQADRFRPLGEVLRELLVLAPVSLHLADDDTSLHGAVSVVLLKPIREAVKVRLVQAARPNEPIRLAATFGVGGRHDIEAGSRLDEHPDLLDVDALALKDGLKAHHALRPQVDLVKEEDRTALHRLNDTAKHELGFAVDEAEATDQVILVSLGGDVDADQVAPGGRANLLNHRGLAVARQTRDVDGSELLGGEDGGDVIVVTPRNESVVLDGDEVDIGGRHDEVVSAAVHVGDCIRSFGGSQDGFKSFFFVFCGDDGVERNFHHLRDAVKTATNTTGSVLDEPSRKGLVVVGRRIHLVGAVEGVDALLTGVSCLTDG